MSFDDYWAAPSAYPCEHIFPPGETDALDVLRRESATLLARMKQSDDYLDRWTKPSAAARCANRSLAFE